MRRREFLIGSTVAAALSGVSGASALRESPIDVVFCEPRYAASRQFAAALAEQGAQVFSTHDDVIRIWRALSGVTRVAGMTQYSDFEILRSAARERGLHVLHEAMHVPEGRGFRTIVVRCDTEGSLLRAISTTCIQTRAANGTLASWLLGPRSVRL